MLDKEPTNLLGEAHGFWDTSWNPTYRVCGNVVNGDVLGCWIWYRVADNYINERTYYAR
jgi:hypothetical protein